MLLVPRKKGTQTAHISFNFCLDRSYPQGSLAGRGLTEFVALTYHQIQQSLQNICTEKCEVSFVKTNYPYSVYWSKNIKWHKQERLWITNAFTHRKIWPYDILWIHHEDITYVKMVGRYIDAVKIFLTRVTLQQQNNQIRLLKSLRDHIRNTTGQPKTEKVVLVTIFCALKM